MNREGSTYACLNSATYAAFQCKSEPVFYYRNDFYFCGFYQCVKSGESLTNRVKAEGLYVKFVSGLHEITYS